MNARTIIGACAILALVGVAVYLLFQIPAVFAIGGLVALVAIFVAIAHDAPAGLS